jgi:hypothetical protein
VNRTRLRVSDELDSSQPAGGEISGLGPIPATLAFVGLGLGCVYLLGRWRRSHAAR